jgi:nitroreductase
MNNINDIIQMRYSPLIFTDKAVSREQVEELLNAARQAPSSFNEQPWRFIYALKSSKIGYERMFSCLARANQEWAASAPVLMATVASERFSLNGKENRHALHDVGQAVAIMTMKAMSRGIYLHQMAGFDASQAKKNLQIPKGFSPVTMIALGYPGNTDHLDGELKKRAESPNTRMSVEEIAFYEKWKG